MEMSRLSEDPLIFRPSRRLAALWIGFGFCFAAFALLIRSDAFGPLLALAFADLGILHATKRKLILGSDYVMFVDLLGRRSGAIPLAKVYRVESSDEGDSDWRWRLQTALGTFTLDDFAHIDAFVRELQVRAPHIEVKKGLPSNG